MREKDHEVGMCIADTNNCDQAKRTVSRKSSLVALVRLYPVLPITDVCSLLEASVQNCD